MTRLSVSRVRAGTKRGDVVGVRLFLRGFSLIELVLVTCILVVLATVAHRSAPALCPQ